MSSYRTDDLAPRRPATIPALDARLSVWGQAAREAAGRRAEALVEGSVLYVERVGRNAEVLRPPETDPAVVLLGTGYDALIQLGARLLPVSVSLSCRLLWVDPDRLRERMAEALIPALEAARAEIRRRQALYRRRARLWQHDQERLDGLRVDLEALKVPRCHPEAPERIARGLLEQHQLDSPSDDVLCEDSVPVEFGLSIRPGSISRWIAQLDVKISEAQQQRY